MMYFFKSAFILGALASEILGSPVASGKGQHASKTKKPFPNSSATPTPVSTPGSSSNSSSSGNTGLGIPSGLLTSKAGISFGFLPDTNGVTMAQINQALGKKSAA